MYDFRCADGKDMNFELLAQRTDYYKNTEEGVSEVCKVIEEMRNEVALNKAIEIAREMLKDGISVEKAAQYSQLSIAMVERLVKTWDPDYTKLTSDEANELRQIMSEMDNGEFVTDEDMDW